MTSILRDWACPLGGGGRQSLACKPTSVKQFHVARFSEGSALVHKMIGCWFDAASTFIAYTRYSSATDADILDFHHTLVRLVSLPKAMDLGASGEAEGRCQRYELDAPRCAVTG